MERVMRAELSSDLGETPDGDVGDVDVLRAVGMASQDRDLTLALSLWRLISLHDGHVLPALARGMQQYSVRHGYALSEGHICAILQWVIDPVCHECSGRGKLLLDGFVNVLSDHECPCCNGTGQSQPKFTEGQKAVRDWLLNLQGFATGAIAKKLRG